MKHVVEEADLTDEPRLDALACRVFDHLPTRSSARKALKREDLLLDGEPARSAWYPRVGQVLTLDLPADRHPPNTLKPQVVFEDEHLAVVVKPAGVLTNGNRHRTLERALPNVLATIGGYPPRPVHRLDFETAGLVVVARTPEASAGMGAAFQERRVQKTYRAIAVGLLEGEGRIEAELDGREAVTAWRALEPIRSLHVTWCTELEVRPTTGRMHQIRRHFSGLGHALLGDARYPTGKVFKNNGLFLAAVGLAFDHPVTGAPIRAAIDPPRKFTSFRAREERRWARWHEDGQRARVRGEVDVVDDR